MGPNIGNLEQFPAFFSDFQRCGELWDCAYALDGLDVGEVRGDSHVDSVLVGWVVWREDEYHVLGALEWVRAWWVW
jgi:hypothetical protein